jgi:hypothetical protein
VSHPEARVTVKARARCTQALRVNGRDAAAALFRYITAVAELTAEQLTEKVLEAAPEVRDTIMTIAEQLEAKGRAKGQQGFLLRQLTLKFGELTDTARNRVTQASEDELNRWTERILSAASIEQVFEDRHPRLLGRPRRAAVSG